MKNTQLWAIGFAIACLASPSLGIVPSSHEVETVGVAGKHPKTVRIKVSKKGFDPAQIRAEKGYELTLIFTRTDKGCTKDVVFQSLNIRQRLILNKEVKVVITPQEAGAITFACSTGNLTGSIAVH